jgi:phosphoenolpyruvate carboxykinase (ATP)
MLSEKMQGAQVNVWLVNTGWTGGPYGTGSRMKLKYTRSMIDAALNGKLDEVAFSQHPIFGLQIPAECENVPSEILNPINTWSDKDKYQTKAKELANSFKANFKKFEEYANKEILSGGPLV